MPNPEPEPPENEPVDDPSDIAQEAATADDAVEDTVADDAVGEDSDESLPKAPPIWSRIAETLRSRRIKALIIAGFVLIAILWGRSFFSSAKVEETLLTLSDEVRLGQEFQKILDGETTRLYIAEYEISDVMLDDLPVASLREARQEAFKTRDATDQSQPSESSSGSTDDVTEIYNDEGKRINFDAPDWQDYPRIDAVLIDQGKITDEGLAKIAELPDLEHIRLRLSPITDEGIKSLSDCDELWLVNLPHSELTNEGLRRLGSVPQLKQLRLGSDRLTNDCCRVIAELTNLRGLHLIGIPVTDDGVKVLSELPHLESLYLDDSAVTELGWEWVFRNHPQLHVHVNQSHHDRDPQAHPH